jgi:hypothetical protein
MPTVYNKDTTGNFRVFVEIGSGKLLGKLCFMQDTRREPIFVGYITHQIAMQFTFCNFLELSKGEITNCHSYRMGAKELGQSFERPLVKQAPWLRKRLNGWSTTNEKFKIPCGRITTIGKNDNNCNIGDGFILWAKNRNQLAATGINKSALTNNIVAADQLSLSAKQLSLRYLDGIVAADQISLNYLDGGINRDRSKSCNSNIIIWLLPISLFALGIICVYHGAPRRSFYGFMIQACACILWVTATIIALSFWFDISLSESASVSSEGGGSATCYRRAEDVRVVPVVVAPFEFGNVQRQIFAADFVEAAHNAALQKGPEAIDRLSMNRAVNILTSAMPHGAVFFQLAITRIFVGRDQADFFRDSFADEAVQGFGIGVFDDARHNIALALDGANNGVLAFSTGSWGALIPMPISVLAADVSFIHFNNTHELTEFLLGEPRADAMAHVMCGMIRTEAEHPLYLQCGYAFLASQHQVNDFEPRLERNVCVLKDRSDKHREPVATLWNAFSALPVEMPVCYGVDVFIATARATDTFWPTATDQVLFARVIRRKQPLELRDSHLLGEFDRAHKGNLHA